MRRFVLTTYLWVLLLPLGCTFVGAASNQIVLIANHDTFPVMMNASDLKKFTAEVHAAQENEEIDPSTIPDIDNGMLDNSHCIMTPYTHLNFLADIFDFKTAYFSVGDGLLEVGDWLWSFCPFVWLVLVVRKLS
jgi:uncharacterized protein DUF5317